ncbi:MAG: hypothetical protein Q9207_006329, partial [Kuettlingeria erythrocarpa]
GPGAVAGVQGEGFLEEGGIVAERFLRRFARGDGVPEREEKVVLQVFAHRGVGIEERNAVLGEDRTSADAGKFEQLRRLERPRREYDFSSCLDCAGAAAIFEAETFRAEIPGAVFSPVEIDLSDESVGDDLEVGAVFGERG